MKFSDESPLKITFIFVVIIGIFACLAKPTTAKDDGANQSLADEVLLNEWEEFKALYVKIYNDPEEDQRRFQIYLSRRQEVSQHNRDEALGLSNYRMVIDKYSDLDQVEIMRAKGIAGLPVKVDWRSKNFVTGVKQSGDCGASWAFAATAVLESAYAIKSGQLVAFSEQNLIDCSTMNHGCLHGWPQLAFDYVIENGGIITEQDYPYNGRKNTCRYSNNSLTFPKVIERIQIKVGSELELQKAVAIHGPVAATIDLRDSFMSHRSGVYVDEKCSRNNPVYSVAIIGYDSDPIDGDYWIVKNSWGSDWGESGYIKMARNQNNMCGIASAANYPVL